MKYDAAHSWQGDNHFSASLASFNKLFASFGYVLVCCNASSGANAFFVQREFSHLFAEIPDRLDLIYQPPLYYLYEEFAHRPSPATIEAILGE